MRARLVSLDVPEAFGGDVRAYRPADPDRVSVLVEAMVEPEDGGPSERFDFRVCTPGWLAGAQRGPGYEFVQHTLLVDHWNAELVERAIAELCASTDERDWPAVTAALSRYGRGEFDAFTLAS